MMNVDEGEFIAMKRDGFEITQTKGSVVITWPEEAGGMDHVKTFELFEMAIRLIRGE